MQLVVTAVGPDRPGLVGEFSGLVHAAGANLADSRMINLRGQFALVALIEGNGGVLEGVRASLRKEGTGLGLRLEFAEATAPGEGKATAPGVPFLLKTYSTDQAGIVHRITSYLKEHRINIEELETELESAAFAGTPVFTMQIRMIVPLTLNISSLRRSLEELGDSLNCDVDLERG